jgi:hypothetical protein
MPRIWLLDFMPGLNLGVVPPASILAQLSGPNTNIPVNNPNPIARPNPQSGYNS